MGAILGFADVVIMAQIIDNLVVGASVPTHLLLVTLLGLFILLRSGFDFVENGISFYVRTLLNLELRAKFLGSVLAKPLEDLQPRRIGELVHIETSSLAGIEARLTDGLPELVNSLSMLVVAVLLMFKFNPHLGMAFVGLSGAWFLTSLFFYPYFERHMNAVYEATADSRSFFVDALRNAELVRILRISGLVMRRYVTQIIQESLIAGRFLRFNMIQDYYTAILPIVLVLVAYLYGGLLVIDGKITIGDMVAFNIIASRAVGPVSQLVDFILGLPGLKVAAERVFEHLDPEFPVDLHVEVSGTRVADADLNAAGLTMGYGDHDLWRDVSLTVRPGQLVVVRGDSGSGKTTFLHCLAGFQAPQAGTVHYGASPVNDLPSSAIQFVPSYPAFFQTSIRKNLEISQENRTDDDELAEALQLAAATDAVAETPAGLDTELEEDNLPLSKGQLQRIALARALLLRPNLLLLDESLSGIEQGLEREIMQTLRDRRPNLTIICATHRDNLDDLADDVVLLGVTSQQ